MAMGLAEKATLNLKGVLHNLMDKFSDPSTMSQQLVREIDDAIVSAKHDMAETKAQYNMALKNLEDAKSKVKKWQDNASLAVDKGDDELAKAAITEKNKAQALVNTYTAQADGIKPVIDQFDKQLAELEAKRDEMKIRAQGIATREGVANAQITANKVMGNMSGSFGDTMDELEQKTMKKEAYAQATTSSETALEDKFKTLGSSSVDDELAALKASRGRG